MTGGYLCIKQVHHEEVGLGIQDIGTLLVRDLILLKLISDGTVSNRLDIYDEETRHQSAILEGGDLILLKLIYWYSAS